jgi:hypothetical protein
MAEVGRSLFGSAAIACPLLVRPAVDTTYFHEGNGFFQGWLNYFWEGDGFAFDPGITEDEERPLVGIVVPQLLDRNAVICPAGGGATGDGIVVSGCRMGFGIGCHGWSMWCKNRFSRGCSLLMFEENMGFYTILQGRLFPLRWTT